MNNVRITFINRSGEPYFSPDHSVTTDFTENTIGRDEERIIPEAIDPKNEGVINEDDMIKIYYFIDGDFITFV